MYVPKRNIEPVVVDVKRPAFNYAAGARRRTVDLRTVPLEPHKKNPRLLRSIGFAVLLSLALAGGAAVAKVASVRVFLSQKEHAIAEQFRASAGALKNLDMKSAQESLTSSLSDLQEVQTAVGAGSSLFNGIASVIPFVQNIGGFVSQLTTFNRNLISLSTSVEDLQTNGMHNFLHDGNAFLGELAALDGTIGNVLASTSGLKNSVSELQGVKGFGSLEPAMRDYYLSYGSELYGLQSFIGDLRNLLASPEEQRVLIMFQNDSEIRPAGGFLGSYGVLSVQGGEMKDLAVQDIYWPDSPLNFNLKLIPPKALQHTTTDWGARDANWFFNFPDSAEAVLSFLESSKVYAASSTKFAGAIAINTKVLETLIGAVGPLTLQGYDTTITKDNFLEVLQREVETGPDKQPGKNPKRILSVLAPVLLQRLEALSPDEVKALLGALGEHIANKDIMFYFRDNNIENALASYGVDGSVYTLPTGFWGSYLAVVNADVAGGKTDAVMKQNVEAWIDVGIDGSSVVNVAVKRSHTGTKNEDPWYQQDNKDYLKLFTNDGAELLSLQGNTVRPDVNGVYGKEYMTYPALAKIEATRVYLPDEGAWSMEEAGKEVFSTWLMTKMGETKELDMRFRDPAVGGFALAPGAVYQFVFDKQSGSETGLTVHVSAPVGYVWKEAGAPVYTADFPSVSKREIVNLTLMKKE